MIRSALTIAAAGCVFALSAAAQQPLAQSISDPTYQPAVQSWPAPAPAVSRGAPGDFVDFFEDFQTHPLSTDPVFDRFQVLPGDGLVSPFFWQSFNGGSAAPSLFLDGQTDLNGTPDPIPRWQGIAIDELPNPLTADINNDGSVDAADLGILVGAFGMMGMDLDADINGDGVVHAADLGALIGDFGATFGDFCVYEITLVLTTDNFGEPIEPGDLNDGPLVGERIGFETSADCGLCDTFTFMDDETGISFIGEWTLIDSMAPGLAGVQHYGDVVSAGCDDWGDDRVLASLRGERGLPPVPTGQTSVTGTLTGDYVALIPDGEYEIIAEVDIFIPSHKSTAWVDFWSTYETTILSRFLTGGEADAFGVELSTFANAEGFIDRFVILGVDCGLPFCIGGIAGIYGSVPDPDYNDPGPPFPTPTPLPGKKTLAGEWLTMRHIVTPDEHHEVWVRDSETMALTDPNPGDDGRSTESLLDDIEDGFARIFPAGPYGRMRLFDNQICPDPSPPFATTVTSVRMFYTAEDDTLPRADRNFFIDNVSIRGPRATTPPAP